MATTETKLNMVFQMDNEKKKTITIRDAVTSLQGSDVQPVMADIISKQAIISGTAVPDSIDKAVLITTTENKLV